METKCLNYPEAKDSSNFSKATIKGGIRSNRIKIAKMICNQTGICLPPQNLFCFDGNIGIANRHFTPKLPKVNRTESYHWTNIGITVKWCIASDLVEDTCKEYVTLVPIKQS